MSTYRRRPISKKYARALGDRLEVEWDYVDFDEFAQGLVVEQEHLDTVEGDMEMVAMIALDHLAEFPDYYTRLYEMERKASKYWGK